MRKIFFKSIMDKLFWKDVYIYYKKTTRKYNSSSFLY